MPSHLDIALSIHSDAITHLRLREAEIASELQSVRREIEALEYAADSLRRVFGAAPAPTSSTADPSAHGARSRAASLGRSDASAQPRARIGEQRYLMFVALRDLGGLSQGDITKATGLSERRVKDQMKSDIRLGMVSEEGGILTLTDDGEDLLRRFVEYRSEAGKPLPKLPLAGQPTPQEVAMDQGIAEEEFPPERAPHVEEAA